MRSLFVLLLLLPAPALAQTIDVCNFAPDSPLTDLAKDVDAIIAAATAGTPVNLKGMPQVIIVPSKERPSFQMEAGRAVDLIRNTEQGRDILKEIRDRGRPVRVVYAKGQDPLWIEMRGQPYSVILVDPVKIPGTIDKDGKCNPTPLARALAHELGHAAGEMNESANVVVNENFVAQELGLKPRVGYSPGCLPPTATPAPRRRQ